MLGIGISFDDTRNFKRQEEDRKLLPFVLGSACATAAYSVVDGMGARVMGDAIAMYRGFLSYPLCFIRPLF